MGVKVLLKHSFHLNSSSWLFSSSADPRKPPSSAIQSLLGGKRCIGSHGAGLAHPPPTQFASINAAAARVRPGRATDSPRETPPVGHLTCYGSTFLSHSITIPCTHIRRCDTSKRAQMRTMMHDYNEKWHVQGPQAPLNQCVGGNSTDLLKTSDVLIIFGC